MKKFMASVLSVAIVMSLAACNGKQGMQNASETTAQVTETTEITETTEATKASETAETTTAVETTETTAAALNKADYVKDKVVKFKVKEDYNKKKKKWTYSTIEFHFPELLIKSDYADSINKAMDKMIKNYTKEFKDQLDTGDLGTEYIAYLTKDGILSIVFIETFANDQIECKVYNIDVKTGEKVDNARIAEIAGVSNIRKSAMDALQAMYNEGKVAKLKDYKVVKKKGQKKNEEDKAVEKSFNSKHLNDKMRIGLTDEGKIFFVSEYFDGCCDDNNAIYDANGKDLYDDKNPNWVGHKE